MQQAVIFDFDGVILDSEPIHYKACCLILKKIGLSVSFEEYREKYLGLTDKDLFPLLLKHKKISLNPNEIHDLIQTKINCYNEIIHHSKNLPIIPGLELYIQQLQKQNIPLAICSGSARIEIDTVLKNLHNGKLQSHFNVIVTAENINQGKPSPEGFLLAAKKLNITPEKCLVIEDSPHGVEAGKKAGMTVIALLTSHDKNKLKKADLIVQDFNELLHQNNN